jgi:hypothetical protein
MPLIAGLNPAIMGLIALAVIVGVLLIAQVVGYLISQAVPIPGLGAVARVVGAGVESVINRLGRMLDAIARGCAAVIAAIPLTLVDLGQAVYAGVRNLRNLLAVVFFEAIPSLYRTISSVAGSIIHSLTDLINRLIAQAMAYATAIRNYLVGLVNASVAWLRSLIDSVYRTLAASIAAGIAYVTNYALSLYRSAVGLINSVYASLVRLIDLTRLSLQGYALALAKWAIDSAVGIATDWARRYADAVMDALNRAINAATAIALAPAYPRILDAIDGISLALPDSIAAVLQRIGAFPRTIPRELAIGVGAIAAASAVAVDWVKECGLPLCRNTRRFGDELEALGDAAMMAVIFEMIIDAINDPDSSAHDTIDNLASPLTAAVREFGDIIGIAA